ncbi:MAG: pseudaminic acid synthase [Cytophagaceae bacterium]|nr:pseudaminic acid synthase [Cytophagaceae bacterium]
MIIKIGDKKIGENSPTFIIAELSANHNQKLEVALDTVKAAKDVGADAIKLQHYTPDTITIDCDNKYFQINQGTLWDGTTLYKLYKEAFMPWEWTEKIMRAAEDNGLICFSSPFDFTAVDFLEKFNVPAYKIASFEITDIPLIEYVAAKGKPVIISTGIATMEEIELAMETCRKAGNSQVALLKCTSSYPAPLSEMNLNTIPDMKERFKVVIGLSDHSLGTTIPVAAVALGAKIIEKHFILDKSVGGPDAAFSLEPHEFKSMVQAVRDSERALGQVQYELTEKVKKSRDFSRSLFIVKDIKKGEVLTAENLRSIRPGFGLHPRYYKEVLGKRVNIDLLKGTPLSFEHLS